MNHVVRRNISVYETNAARWPRDVHVDVQLRAGFVLSHIKARDLLERSSDTPFIV
jgi:hypothetical protein